MQNLKDQTEQLSSSKSHVEMFSPPKFQSFMMAGFECTYALNENNVRMDLLKTTRHDALCREDYKLIKELNIRTVREGLAWNQIDRNGKYNFSRFEEMMAIGREENIEQIWDLNHFDFPEDLDPFSPEFIDRFAKYAAAAIQVIRKYTDRTIYICPVNEISYFSYIAGDTAKWAPHQGGKGFEFKKMLVKAAIAAMDAIWEKDNNVRFIQVDPILYRKPKKPVTQNKLQFAKDFNEIKFQAWDMLVGKVCPELGGHPKYLDIIGCNYYYQNQEWIDADENGDIVIDAIPMYSKHRITLGTMLKQVYLRYKRPIVITETGAYGELRKKWWKRILRELEQAKKRLPIYGMCIYPTLDNPAWFGEHLVNSGLWDFQYGDAECCRIPHTETIDILHKYTSRATEQLKPLQHQL